MNIRPSPPVELALRFILQHLAEPLTVAHVARQAGVSEFHLHRLFHAETGESVGRTITRKRLEMSALELAYRADVPITTIALESGYSSAANFTKAFTAFFGCSPTEVRRGEVRGPRASKLLEDYDKTFLPEQLYLHGPLEAALRKAEATRLQEHVRFEEAVTMPFACLASPAGYDLPAILDTWQELIMRCAHLGICDGPVDAWGIPFDSPVLTAPDQRRYHACVPCPEGARLPRPLFAGTRPAGRYAVFPYQGEAALIADAYKAIYSCWFPESSVVPADYLSLDHYVGDAPQDGQVTMDLWIRVIPRA